MPQTVIFDAEPFTAASASGENGDLLLSREELAPATGWDVKPQGFCRGEVCVPVPPARRPELLPADGRVNLSAFARLLGRVAVRDDAGSAWAFSRSPAASREGRRGASAPDFRLPDLDGNLHALSDYRGSKVLLLSWASW